MKKLIAAIALAAAALVPAVASASDHIQVGRLSCIVEPGIGLLFGSRKDMTCTFHPNSGPDHTFSGQITKIGLDVGITERTRIEWLVFTAGDNNFEADALAGRYVGASAEASLVVGGGANWLIGGDKDSFMLQPWSGQAQIGLNLAVGLTGLRLN
ncbi:MAG: DUF992 domain-containing protein [Hyphomicrobiaceae bacterium]|nr:DUF992 domain-containing protein [Hyphomicrobiaceae bacterium]